MRATYTVLAPLALLTAAFAGCIDGGALTADFTWTTSDNRRFVFDAGPSSGDVAAYRWDFGDGTTAEGSTVEHEYEYVNGEYTVTLRVVGDDGQEVVTTKKVRTGDAPNQLPMLALAVDKRWVKPGEEVTFDATGAHDMDGDPITLRWDFNYDIDPAEFDTLVNLGMQQYMAADPGMGAMSPPDNGSSPYASADDPSLGDMVRDVVADFTGENGLHGGDAGPPYTKEPSNADFDGRVNDTSPIQIFSWDAPAHYFVRLDATDIKGGTTSGFIAMRVTGDAPEPVQTVQETGTILFSGPGALDMGVENASNKWDVGFTAQYPGHIAMNGTITGDPLGMGQILLFLCANDATLAQCDDQPLAKGGPGTEVSSSFHHAAHDPFPLRAYLVAESETPSAVNLEVQFTANLTYDTNPWYEYEAAGSADGGGHH